MPKKYRVTLTAAEREELERLLSRGKADVRCLKHAQMLLKADEAEGGPGWSDERVADAFDAGVATIERLRQRFVEEGLQAALRTYRTGTRLYERKLDGAQEAHLIALACSAPPDERARWTLRLLAQRMVELAYVDTLSYETVRQTLKPDAQKRTPSSRTGERCGAFPTSPRRSSSTTWKTCWRSTTARTIPSVRWCAWTRPSSSSSARPASPCRCDRARSSALTTSTPATGLRACSWPANRWQAGATLT